MTKVGQRPMASMSEMTMPFLPPEPGTKKTCVFLCVWFGFFSGRWAGSVGRGLCVCLVGGWGGGSNRAGVVLRYWQRLCRGSTARHPRHNTHQQLVRKRQRHGRMELRVHRAREEEAHPRVAQGVPHQRHPASVPVCFWLLCCLFGSSVWVGGCGCGCGFGSRFFFGGGVTTVSRHAHTRTKLNEQ